MYECVYIIYMTSILENICPAVPHFSEVCMDAIHENRTFRELLSRGPLCRPVHLRARFSAAKDIHTQLNMMGLQEVN